MRDRRNILVIGGGGREHALVHTLAKSAGCGDIYCLPGNGGTVMTAKTAEADINDHAALIDLVHEKNIDLVVVGPEQPLVEGIVDRFRSEGLEIFGPDKSAARLEGSKAYSKDFMRRYGIPTAEHMTVSSLREGLEYLAGCSYPIVVKASGLAAGKGVIIAESRKVAEEALRSMLVERSFGAAGQEVVIEEFLKGEEMSIFILTDGKSYHILPTARDHKRAYTGDLGPNTGGMGAYAPADPLDEDTLSFIRKEIIERTLHGIREDGGHYIGILYIGLMLGESGPKVLEYNCRFGDPEAQVILPLIENDLVDLIEAAQSGNLSQKPLEVSDRHCATVVLASGGYPGTYKKGLPILGADENEDEDVIIFHAGTIRSANTLTSNGGRVLAVTALAETREQAVEKAYQRIGAIQLQESFYRTDIGSPTK